MRPLPDPQQWMLDASHAPPRLLDVLCQLAAKERVKPSTCQTWNKNTWEISDSFRTYFNLFNESRHGETKYVLTACSNQYSWGKRVAANHVSPTLHAVMSRIMRLCVSAVSQKITICHAPFLAFVSCISFHCRCTDSWNLKTNKLEIN